MNKVSSVRSCVKEQNMHGDAEWRKKLRQVHKACMDKMISNMYEDKKTADVDVYVEGTCYKAHRCLLSISPFLKKILLEQQNSDTPVSISIPGISKSTFSRILLLLYQGKLESDADYDKIIDALKFLGIPDLPQIVSDHAKKKQLNKEPDKGRDEPADIPGAGILVELLKNPDQAKYNQYSSRENHHKHKLPASQDSRPLNLTKSSTNDISFSPYPLNGRFLNMLYTNHLSAQLPHYQKHISRSKKDRKRHYESTNHLQGKYIPSFNYEVNPLMSSLFPVYHEKPSLYSLTTTAPEIYVKQERTSPPREPVPAVTVTTSSSSKVSEDSKHVWNYTYPIQPVIDINANRDPTMFNVIPNTGDINYLTKCIQELTAYNKKPQSVASEPPVATVDTSASPMDLSSTFSFSKHPNVNGVDDEFKSAGPSGVQIAETPVEINSSKIVKKESVPSSPDSIEVIEERPMEPSPIPRKSLMPTTNISGRKRKGCGKCEACQNQEDCGECRFCKDKSKYGGPNKLKQVCSRKRCAQLDNDPENRKRRRLAKPKKVHKCGECIGCKTTEDCGECNACLSNKTDPRRKELCELKTCEVEEVRRCLTKPDEPSPYSTDSVKAEALVRYSPDESDGHHKSKKFKRKADLQNSSKAGRTKYYCGNCEGCKRQTPCKSCMYCIDMPKFGGHGKYRQKCTRQLCRTHPRWQQLNRAKCMEPLEPTELGEKTPETEFTIQPSDMENSPALSITTAEPPIAYNRMAYTIENLCPQERKSPIEKLHIRKSEEDESSWQIHIPETKPYEDVDEDVAIDLSRTFKEENKDNKENIVSVSSSFISIAPVQCEDLSVSSPLRKMNPNEDLSPVQCEDLSISPPRININPNEDLSPVQCEDLSISPPRINIKPNNELSSVHCEDLSVSPPRKKIKVSEEITPPLQSTDVYLPSCSDASQSPKKRDNRNTLNVQGVPDSLSEATEQTKESVAYCEQINNLSRPLESFPEEETIQNPIFPESPDASPQSDEANDTLWGKPHSPENNDEEFIKSSQDETPFIKSRSRGRGRAKKLRGTKLLTEKLPRKKTRRRKTPRFTIDPEDHSDYEDFYEFSEIEERPPSSLYQTRIRRGLDHTGTRQDTRSHHNQYSDHSESMSFRNIQNSDHSESMSLHNIQNSDHSENMSLRNIQNSDHSESMSVRNNRLDETSPRQDIIRVSPNLVSSISNLSPNNSAILPDGS